VVLKRQQLTEKIANTYKSIVGPPKSLSLEDVRNLNVLRQNNLKALHELLIAPVLPMVPREPDAIVTIVPHGPLFSVPFAALMSSNGKFLAEDHTLSYAPAIGVLRATQKLNDETKNDPSSLLAFGNPITKAIAFLGALPYAEKEVNHVAELFGATRSTVRVSGQATKQAFAQLAPKSTVVHLATHGLIDEEHPMQSAVVLAPEGRDDGLLTVKDILQLPSLKAKLVVLSACQTGRGKITGDGVIGLSRSFIIAGTPAVMVSQWNVDDVMTEYQMVAFYKEFLKNMGKARALRKAQLETIAILEKGGSTTGGTNTRANPRYWAAFQMIGEPN
jgi:CHAT domain-containing protein